MNAQAPLVSVIVPMYNAVSTVRETLESIAAQTHRNLEIIVVDDGSTDGCKALVEEFARHDPRILLHSQKNAGVAAARNTGASLATSEFFAPVDADDLWTPDKIERQLEVMLSSDDSVGLVYTWYSLIDISSHVFAHNRPEAEGRILRDLCRANVIGNGSSTMMRRSAFERVSGYDGSLRDRGGQGAEDLDIAIRIAEFYEIRLIRDCLTGYRQLPDTVSCNVFQMLRSYELVMEAALPRHPQYASELHQQWLINAIWLLQKALNGDKLKSAFYLIGRILRREPLAGSKALVPMTYRILRALVPHGFKKSVRGAFFKEEPKRDPVHFLAPSSSVIASNRANIGST